MDKAIASVISGIVFIAFTAGLAESIGDWPFVIIVGVAIVLMVFSTYEVVRDAALAKKKSD